MFYGLFKLQDSLKKPITFEGAQVQNFDVTLTNNDKFQSPIKLSEKVKYSNYVMFVISVLTLIVPYMIGGIFLWSGAFSTFAENSYFGEHLFFISPNGLLLGLFGLAAAFLGNSMYIFPFLLIASIYRLKWIYLISHNSKNLSSENMSFSPGWAVGWFLIPIANLWKPYQVLKELLVVNFSPLVSEQDKKKYIRYLQYAWIIYIIHSYVFLAALIFCIMFWESVILVYIICFSFPILRITYWILNNKIISCIVKLQMLKKDYYISNGIKLELFPSYWYT